jgi:maltose O-acetyltransferase
MGYERPSGVGQSPGPEPLPTSATAAARADVEPSVAVRLQILSTAHWSLLGSRSRAWNESFSRAAVFLSTVTGAIVALALVAQASEFGQGFRLFALVITVTGSFRVCGGGATPRRGESGTAGRPLAAVVRHRRHARVSPPYRSPMTGNGDPSPDARTQRERMLAGDPYVADDPELAQDILRAAILVKQFNDSQPSKPEVRRRILDELLGSLGEGTEIRPPFHCDYGYQIHVGARTFVNFGLVALDVAPIRIGDDVQVGPGVQLLTPTHPLEPEPRCTKVEAAEPITIGHNVWLAGGVVVCPGVTIGANAVVGAGSVVLEDIPAGVLAVGAPARVVRSLV